MAEAVTIWAEDICCMAAMAFSFCSVSKYDWWWPGTFSLAWISLSFLLASTWMWELTCFLVLVFPVLSLM